MTRSIQVRTSFSTTEAEAQEMGGQVAVVIDVIRATSVIVTAMANGARAIYPTLSTEEAIRLAHSLGREDTLLCGERKGLRVEGFHLGNSPAEFTAEAVGGKQLVMSTTNGTRALWATLDAERTFILAFLNLRATARAVLRALAGREDAAITVVCAGKEGAFALDDAVCAGLFVGALDEALSGADEAPGVLHLDDASRAAVRLAEAFPLSEPFLRGTAAGDALVDIGLAGDLRDCVRRDSFTLVPELVERVIRLPQTSEDGGAGVAGSAGGAS